MSGPPSVFMPDYLGYGMMPTSSDESERRYSFQENQPEQVETRAWRRDESEDDYVPEAGAEFAQRAAPLGSGGARSMWEEFAAASALGGLEDSDDMAPPPAPEHKILPYRSQSVPRDYDANAVPPLAGPPGLAALDTEDTVQALAPTFPRSSSVNDSSTREHQHSAQFIRSNTTSAVEARRAGSHSPTPARSPPPADRPAALSFSDFMSELASMPASFSQDDPDLLTPKATDNMTIPMLSLPSLAEFPQGLSAKDYKLCAAPWSLSTLYAWLCEIMARDLNLMKEDDVLNSLVGLFTYTVPKLKWIEAEECALSVIETFKNAGCLRLTENYLGLIEGKQISGVIPLFTGRGCYSVHAHNEDNNDVLVTAYCHCYAHTCRRSLANAKYVSYMLNKDKKTAAAEATPDTVAQEWSDSVPAALLASLEPREIKRQCVIHELISLEELFIADLKVFLAVYRDPLLNAESPIIPNQEAFVKVVFDAIPEIIEVNSKYLLKGLKEKQQAGPLIAGISDVFLEWVRPALKPYLKYHATLRRATELIKEQKAKSVLFKTYVASCDKNPRTGRQSLDHYLNRVTPRLLRYRLLLETMQKYTPETSQESKLLRRSLTEATALVEQCNAKFVESEKDVMFMSLQQNIVFKSDDIKVNLNLGSQNRSVIKHGYVHLPRTRHTDCFLILLDNFLVLTKPRKDANGVVKYIVSKPPIPMNLLVLESGNEEPVTKSHLFGLSSFASTVSVPGAATPTAASAPTTLGSLGHRRGQNSISSMGGKDEDSGQAVTKLGDLGEVYYPFRFTHLGRHGQTYTLFTTSHSARDVWCNKIMMAKQGYASSMYSLRSEPFSLWVVSDLAFGYEPAEQQSKQVPAPGSVLERALRAAEHNFSLPGARPRPLAQTRVNCAVTFAHPETKTPATLVGCDFGVYFSNGHPRNWTQVLRIAKVTQIEVLEEFGYVLVLSDKTLLSYAIETVVGAARPKEGRDAALEELRASAYKLSGSRDVSFFATGKLKDRTVVITRRKDTTSQSVFKVYEPLGDKPRATDFSRRLSRFQSLRKAAGAHVGVERYREADRFYVHSECFGLSLFKASLAVHAAKGIEIMRLEDKHALSVPDLAGAEGERVRRLIFGQRPLGMFKISTHDFLLCYENCALYTDRHGLLSRAMTIEFVGQPRAVAFEPPYLIVFDPSFVEIWHSDTGELKQVISGKDIRLLSQHEGQVMFAIAHPEAEDRQLLVRMVVNPDTI
ncbi:CNH domain-containing protein [Dipodascopsis tothii]|uniref:CNH domain-containing protein n=1 Tax=Dipodascopsis tothii TaxID=44089 RepID=UPI0034CD7A35